jgi:glutamate dehydrogenase
MTSLSIRQYVLGIYKQLGLREKDITKVQTGGPGKLHLYSLGLVLDMIFVFIWQMEILVQVSHDFQCLWTGSINFLVDEILLSSDKTVAIIDGSGVLADPAGINREELIRLAKLRLTVANFDKTKLSKDGYLVKVEEQDVKLPCMLDFLIIACYLTLFLAGEIILDGTDFRNGAHLRFKADLFVPCGGRSVLASPFVRNMS